MRLVQSHTVQALAPKPVVLCCYIRRSQTFEAKKRGANVEVMSHPVLISRLGDLNVLLLVHSSKGFHLLFQQCQTRWEDFKLDLYHHVDSNFPKAQGCQHQTRVQRCKCD
jgi:hypothetical protein